MRSCARPDDRQRSASRSLTQFRRTNPGRLSIAMTNERPLTKDMKADSEALTLKEYMRVGGYQGIRKALRMEPKEITDLVTKSNLRGRGGAGFVTGSK